MLLLLGAAFDRNKKLNAAILDYAVATANKNILSGSDIELKYTIELIDYGNEFMAAEGVCRLLEVCDFLFSIKKFLVLDFKYLVCRV